MPIIELLLGNFLGSKLFIPLCLLGSHAWKYDGTVNEEFDVYRCVRCGVEHPKDWEARARAITGERKP